MIEERKRAGTRQWVGLAVLVLPCVLASMDLSVMFVTLPSLTADLQPSSSELLWIMDVYGFLLAGLMITMGTLGDRVGRRRVLLTGAAAFGIASVLAACTSSPEVLIAARALMGIAGATLAPSTLSLIRNMFHDDRQRATAVGVWTAGFAGGAVVGPIIGGLLLEHFWWGSVFLINVPVMILLLVLGPVLLPEYRDSKPGRFDLLGALLSLVAILAVIYGIKLMAEHGFDWTSAVSVLAGLAVGVLFIRRQRTTTNPMLDLALFRTRRFTVPLLVNALNTFAVIGFSLFNWQFMQLVLGMSPFESALWSLPTFLVMPVGIALATAMGHRIGKPTVMIAGLVVATAGYTVLSLIRTDSGIVHLVGALTVVSLGIGGVAAVVTEVILSAAPPERAGAASALAETSAEFGGALGIAILGSIGTAVYRAQLTSRAPAALDPSQLAAAEETLGGAIDTALALPHQTGEALRSIAFHAFTHEMRIAAMVSAVVTAGGAILIATMLRTASTTQHDSHRQADGPQAMP
ncbi:MFS transporter [Amycolatopsis regifaucium]|uniref:MFS transporter n=1 Tax=Amycolatopsis regifaucium TaxID=546365 RepID=A0A154MVN6_9PSEU|nr:MFS transporter [Amycolatopsis regifaucium]KZB88366.1 MFS transporter [Amycolatopsis regifaucium]OKA11477.1 MFS transporter [Amycolatopsis regifaucium]SFH40715.1 MFS transporter, DHA2 family, multidrug resistance protein [Amycolatopsis regifaucium]